MTKPLHHLSLFLAPPSIYYVDPPTETGPEENVTLTCHASGLPQPTFTWLTPDGHAINATAPLGESEDLDDGSKNRRGKIVQQDGSLLIFNTRDVDQGSYKCVAINVMGQDERNINLTVKEGKNRISHLSFGDNFILASVTRSFCIGEERLCNEPEESSEAAWREFKRNWCSNSQYGFTYLRVRRRIT